MRSACVISPFGVVTHSLAYILIWIILAGVWIGGMREFDPDKIPSPDVLVRAVAILAGLLMLICLLLGVR